MQQNQSIYYSARSLYMFQV